MVYFLTPICVISFAYCIALGERYMDRETPDKRGVVKGNPASALHVLVLTFTTFICSFIWLMSHV